MVSTAGCSPVHLNHQCAGRFIVYTAGCYPVHLNLLERRKPFRGVHRQMQSSSFEPSMCRPIHSVHLRMQSRSLESPRKAHAHSWCPPPEAVQFI
jgi:hypothetical protein